ncbi:MAG TPA: hypothetical protein VEA58_03260 [Anaerovoracaceae bacterium]|nr:hypothetical protein [Anaerovoracaceae bacterium]
MNMNVGLLKELIKHVPDDVTIGAVDYRDKLMDFNGLKRVLLIERKGEKVLVFNAMGTHYFNLVEKEGYSVVKCWDDPQKIVNNPSNQQY